MLIDTSPPQAHSLCPHRINRARIRQPILRPAKVAGAGLSLFTTTTGCSDKLEEKCADKCGFCLQNLPSATLFSSILDLPNLTAL